MLKISHYLFYVVEVSYRNLIVVLVIEIESVYIIFYDGHSGATILMYIFVNYMIDFLLWDTIVVNGDWNRRRDGATIWIGGWLGLQHDD